MSGCTGKDLNWSFAKLFPLKPNPEMLDAAKEREQDNLQ